MHAAPSDHLSCFLEGLWGWNRRFQRLQACNRSARAGQDLIHTLQVCENLTVPSPLLLPTLRFVILFIKFFRFARRFVEPHNQSDLVGLVARILYAGLIDQPKAYHISVHR